MPPPKQQPSRQDIEIFRFRGENRELRAVHRNDRQVVLDADGHEVTALSAAEEAALSKEAWSFDETTDLQAAPLAHELHRLWVGPGALPPDPLAVMLDTTTFHNAGSALRSDWPPSAYELLDLSALTVAAVFFDHVVVQPGLNPTTHIHSALPRDKFPDVVHLINPDPRDARELEQVVYAKAVTVTQPSLRKQRHESAWGKLLGRKVTLDIKFVESWNDEQYFSSMPLPQAGESDTTFNEFATQHTVRAEFNDRVAGALSLPYLASSMRLAPASEMVRSRSALLNALRRAARAAAPSKPPRGSSTFAAPFLLGVVLNEMSDRDDFATVLGQLRDAFSDVRDRLREDPNRTSWDREPQKLYQEFPSLLESALSPGSRRHGQVRMSLVKAAIGAIPGVGSFSNPAFEVGMAIRDSPEAARAKARLRADVFALLDFSDQAAQVRTLRTQIGDIWGTPVDDEDDDVLKQISEFDADPLFTPRALD
jgi:hypothetical protein